MSAKLLFIVNPVSGRKGYARHFDKILNIFEQKGWDVSAFMTEGRGDARDMAATMGQDYNRIVCFGGDGTLSEVVNGLAEIDFSVQLGYIPAGSTNDFAMSLELAPDVLTAAEDAAGGIERPVDVMRINDRYSVNASCMGIFTNIAYDTPQNLKNTLGLAAYIISGVRDLSNLRAEHLCFTTESGTREGDYFFVSICNSTALGESFSHSEADDGLFDAVLLRKPPSLAELQHTARQLRSENYQDAWIETIRSSHMTIESENGIVWAVDGERYEAGTKTVVDILPQKLRLIVPPSTEKSVPSFFRAGRWLAVDLGKRRS